MKARYVPLVVRQRICAMPCAVCGVPWVIKVDHIVPVACGGGADEDNLQPLCHDCNHIKTHRLDNAGVRAVVARRGLRHFLLAAWRHDTRFDHSYDCPSMERWLGSSPDIELEAFRLYLAFIGGTR